MINNKINNRFSRSKNPFKRRTMVFNHFPFWYINKNNQIKIIETKTDHNVALWCNPFEVDTVVCYKL